MRGSRKLATGKKTILMTTIFKNAFKIYLFYGVVAYYIYYIIICYNTYKIYMY